MDPKNASSEGLLAFLREFYPEVYAVVPREIVSKSASANTEISSVEASPRSCPTVSESGRSSPAPSEASRMEAESAAESGPESSSEISDDDGFETVVSKKRKGKPVKASPPVKRASLAAPPPRANSAASVPAKTAPVTSSGSASNPDEAAPTAPQGRKSRPPPPVILQDKKAWDSISAWMLAHGVNFVNAKSTQQGIKIQLGSPNDHRKLTAHLRAKNVGFHTYALEDERRLRVVIRGIPKELDCEFIESDLKSQALPVQEVHRMHGKDKAPFDMVLVILDLSPEGKKVFDLRSVCRLSGITVMPPRSRGFIGQCHRCQLYGHSARNCFARPRCVKCLGDHGTADCPRKVPDPNVPPSCVLCETQGHPANYRGCSRAPRRRTTRSGAKKGRASRPSRQAPREPSAPRVYVPAPAPLRNAWFPPLPASPAPAHLPAHPPAVPAHPPAVPARSPAFPAQSPAPRIAPRPATAPRPVQAPAPVSRQVAMQVPPRTNPAPAGHSLTADLSVVMDFVSSFDVCELSVFANKIRSSNGAPHARMQAVLEHAGLIDAITRFEAPTY